MSAVGPSGTRGGGAAAAAAGAGRPSSAHAGILAAAAHFDTWRAGLGSKNHPEVFLAGYQSSWCSDSDNPEWATVPQLTRSGLRRKKLQVNLTMEHPPNLYGFACPAIHHRA